MRHKDRKVETVGQLVRAIRDRARAGQVVWYRGQADKTWELTPSIARTAGWETAEAALMKRFQQNALPHLRSQPREEWEWLFLMQHYRVPTRLLDWSESPLAAAYFTVTDRDDRDGALWCLDPVALNREANVGFGFELEVPAFGNDEVTENYLPSRIASERTSQLYPIAVTGPRNSPRIAAQLGTFTITHRAHTAIEQVGKGDHIWRLLIPKKAKAGLREELRALRYTKLTLFPELDSVADDAKELLA